MYVHQQGRATGKTYAACEWVAQDPTNRAILAFSAREAARIEDILTELFNLDDEVAERCVLSPGNVRQPGKPKKDLWIDELDAVLRVLLGADVQFATYTPS